MATKRTEDGVVGSLREIVFGLEDSFVSTLGAVTGIAAGAGSSKIVILSGLVLIAVEATSMAAGSYLSSKSVSEAMRRMRRAEGLRAHPLRAGAVMGVAYFLGGFVPLSPYLFLSIRNAYAPSIIATSIALFLLGAWSAGFAGRARWKGGLEMTAIALGATLLGFLIGHIAGAAFGIHPAAV